MREAIVEEYYDDPGSYDDYYPPIYEEGGNGLFIVIPVVWGILFIICWTAIYITG